MKFFLLGLFIFISVNIFSIEFNTYNMEKVHVYKTGRLDKGAYDTLGTFFQENSGPISNGPTIGFFNGSLHILDVHRNRTLKLNENFEIDTVLDFNLYEGITYEMNDSIVKFDSNTSIVIVNNNSVKSIISLDNLDFLRNPKSIYYQQNTIFIHDKENKLWSIKNPGLDNKENRKNILNQDKTLDLIYSGKYKGLTIDSDKRLILNGQLQTLDYEAFYNYYKSKNPDKEKLTLLEFEIGSKNYSYLKYIRNDYNGNSYWDMGDKYICIFNKKGLLFNFFEYDSKKSSTTPTVSQEGDIFFLHNAEDAVTLYKIKRQW